MAIGAVSGVFPGGLDECSVREGAGLGFLAAAFFLAVLFAAGFSGAGMCMPGMFICPAAGVAETTASANALAAKCKLAFTLVLREREAALAASL
jgi:hypothetical protein